MDNLNGIPTLTTEKKKNSKKGRFSRQSVDAYYWKGITIKLSMSREGEGKFTWQAFSEEIWTLGCCFRVENFTWMSCPFP